MTKKYELTDMTIELYGRKLYRIKAIKNFSDVKYGDLGGWIEFEDNLSHDGNCWVGENAQVYGYARVFGDARVFGNAKVLHHTSVFGCAVVGGTETLIGDEEVY